MGKAVEKDRADNLIVKSNLADTRSRAKALIMAGQVLADDVRVEKAGQLFPVETVFKLKVKTEYVSRAGYKLEGALDDLGFRVKGMSALDVGASTGGFTDCLLQRGAEHVVAVDVGYGIFHWRLRQDPRVTLLERTNARYLTSEAAGDGFDLAVIDVSFISLTLILPAIEKLVKSGGAILAMVKPQFEVGREKVGKGGVVRDPAIQAEAVESVKQSALASGLTVAASAPSKLKGPKGNQEYFLLLEKTG